MKQIATNILWCALAATTLVSCRKDEQPAPDKQVMKNAKQISFSATDYTAYDYNSAGQVTRHIEQWANGSGGVNRLTNVYTYDANRLTRWSNEAGHAQFFYKDGILEKSEHFAANGRKLTDLQYVFQNGRLLSVTERIANPWPDDIKETRISFSYYGNGNVSRIDYAYRKELSDPFSNNFSKVYESYDDKPNPEPDGVEGVVLPGVVLHKNNPVKVITLQANNTSSNYIRYEYRYNEAGLPIEKKQYLASNNVEGVPVVAAITY